MKYDWKPKTIIPVDAQVAGERLSALRDSGMLTPAAVMEDARPKDAPLHPAFEWRDRVAAQKYRETQAAHVIRSLVIVREHDIPKEPQTFRAFLNVHEEGESQYISRVEVMSDEKRRSAAILAALARAKGELDGFADAAELAPVFVAIDGVRQELKARNGDNSAAA